MAGFLVEWCLRKRDYSRKHAFAGAAREVIDVCWCETSGGYWGEDWISSVSGFSPRKNENIVSLI